MANLELLFASGEDSLSVRSFLVEEKISSLFRVSITARSPRDDLDLDAIVGQPASFRVVRGVVHALANVRAWTGVCSDLEQVRVEPTGLSTYELTIVPALWLLTQRQNNRLFQHVSIPDVIDRLLGEWGIAPVWRIERARYPRLELRVQYGETDYAFFCRLLEEAGISFYFADGEGRGSDLVLNDAPQRNDLRVGPPLPFVDSPTQAQSAELDMITKVRLKSSVRPGRYTLRDFDFARPAYALFSEVPAAPDPEGRLEQYHYRPGSFLQETNATLGSGAASTPGALAEAARTAAATSAVTATPVADDKGVARFETRFGAKIAETGLTSARADKHLATYETNAIDLSAGVVFSVADHPRRDLAPDRRLLATAFRLQGAAGEEWSMTGVAVFAAPPFRPPAVTPKPRIHGAQSALVVGPPGEEIYVDEHGRVRVQFHWDREGRFDDHSSIWMRVSQGWAGSGYGVFSVPRVGHEVLVSFLDGDPDNPIIVGRVFNGVTQVPHRLPENKTVSTWRSETSPGGGGFNEIRFEDAAGREMIFEHAQRDRNQIVRGDQRSATGGSNTRVVQQEDHVAVGGNRVKAVGLSETEAVGLAATEAVGVTKNVIVGGDEAHVVGSKFSVTMARGLASRFAKELGRVLSSSGLGDLHAPVQTLLGRIPSTALGGPLAALVDGPLADLLSRTQAAVDGVLHLVEGYANDPGPPPTTFEMMDRKIHLTTGEASIVIDGPNISFFADGDITLHARGSVGVLADKEAALSAKKTVLIQSRANDLVILGGPMVKMNPEDPPVDAPTLDEQLRLKDRMDPKRSCSECGSPMVEDPDVPGDFVCSAQERLGAAVRAADGAEPSTDA
jgi:type VI secretion system secreted protein VgrG